MTGHPTYNQFRSDIASLFPGRCNSNGAIGFFYIDTTQITNGVHTLSWVAYDNIGHNDGLGSRFFTVFNAGGMAAPADAGNTLPATTTPAAVTYARATTCEVHQSGWRPARTAPTP